MKGKVFLSQNLLWVIILLEQLHGYKSCIEKERNALFEIKKYILAISEEGLYDLVLPTWSNDTNTDCCVWEGLKCNRTSGRVIELSIGQMYLKETSLFNLSLLHPFEDVQSLKLSANEEKGFSEDAFNQFIGLFDDLDGYKSLRRLRNLKILDLSSNGFNNSIFPFLGAATSLTTLFLRDNNMNGHFPAKELKDLINLELLDLSKNIFNGSLPIQELYARRNLKALDLSYNEFSGSMELQGICKLKNMQELDLSQNKHVGQFPLCISNMTRLRVLDLSSNQLTGNVPSALGNLESLEYLSLFDNNFEGVFSLGSLTNLSKLKVLKLDSKSNSFQVESESSWKAKFQLSIIVLRSCKLETVPHFLVQQNDLRQVDLSSNKIAGDFPSWLLANNTKLRVLFLQNNSLTSFLVPKSAHNLLFMDASINEFNHLFPENIGWILPHLRYLNLARNGFNGSLPSSIGNMKSIEFLDVSHNSFRGKLPTSFIEGCYSMKILKLSYNKLSGEILPESSTNFTRIQELSMDNNLFTGEIGQGLRSLKDLLLLDISNNNLTGVIPSWIGELQMLNAFLSSNNLLEGEIPISLFNISNLQLLDLSGNILSGGIPPHVNSGYEIVLLLQDNNLSGTIPESLLANVKILDLRNNRLFGNIPELINTESISILLLRGNSFTGRIPRKLCAMRNIHLLDLAHNRLNGSIPSCLSNTSFGLGNVDAAYDYDFRVGYAFKDFEVGSYLEEEESTFESLLVLDQFSMDYKASTPTKIEFATKHRYDSYMGGNLEYMFGMDLSENELSGEIPVELGDLSKLRVLNLSHNHLYGVIPKSFSGMKNVESLDVSFNKLQGQIPQELTELSGLAVFKVSYNNLSGVIPQGKQFNTFDTQSYLGNLLLCGKPTNKSCNSNTGFQEVDKGVEEADDESTTIDMESFYWSFGAAYVTLLVGIFAFLSFNSPWRRAWFYIVDVFITKVRKSLW